MAHSDEKTGGCCSRQFAWLVTVRRTVQEKILLASNTEHKGKAMSAINL